MIYQSKNIMRTVKYIMSFLILCVVSHSNLRAQTLNEFSYSVTGTVKNAETKNPVPGIRITYKDLKSTLTDEKGNFKIQVPSTDASLLVSGPMYTSKYVALKGRTELVIELYKDDFKSYYDLIATPGGEASSFDLTNSWSAVKDNNILSTAITSDEALQGKVAGLNLTHRSGSLAAGSNMYIRGINTMNAGIQPLIIVDGIPYENSIYSTSLLGNYFSNPLTSIDIKDIENITVLKDGTTQYGTKGANGVILIRTIKPKEMETKINFHYHFGVNFVPSEIPVLNAADHKLLISDILQSKGLTGSEIMALPYMNEVKPTIQKWGYEGNVDYFRYNNNTNWQNEITGSGNNQNYYLNVFGGDNVAVYALAIGYMKQAGIVKNTDFERFNTRFNAKVNLTKKMEVNANMSFLFSNKSIIDEGPSVSRNPLLAALTKAPFMASHIYNPEGAMSPVVEDVDVFSNSNPYSLVNTSDRDNSMFRFTGNFEGIYRFSKHLQLNANIGVNFNKEREKVYFPNKGVYFETIPTGIIENASQHRVDRYFGIYTEGAVNYNNTFNADHDLNVKAGIRHQTNMAEDDWAKAANTGSDNFKSISYGDPLYRVIGGQISNWNWLNIFGVVDYDYKDKYYFNYTMAADGSSRYGSEAARLYVFPSASAAWLVSAEQFMKDIDAIDLLKVRVGYGLSGNDEIGNYTGKQYYIPQSLLGNFGLVRGNLADLKLKPEVSHKFNIGLDVALLNERLTFGIDVYQSRVSDMLLRMPLPRETGFPFYLTNAGEMKNSGVDLSVQARILNGKLKWDAGMVASFNKNKVTNLGGQEYITNICNADILTRVGQSVGVFYGYKTNGVYATQEEAVNDGLKIQKGSLEFPFSAGDVKFVDKDDNGIINDKDKEIIGNPNPDVYGSLFSNFKYKNWGLNCTFNYSVGNDIYNYTRAQLESMSNFNNQTQAVINRWKADGDITNVPRAVYGDPMGNARFSDRWIEDGSYLRLKTLTLSYDMKLKSEIISMCTFFASGENIFVLTKYKGYDPEFALGVSPLYSGIDGGFLPAARTFSVGVKLDL